VGVGEAAAFDEFQTAFWGAKRAMAVAAEAAYNRHGVRAGQQFILQCLWQTDGLAPGEIARRLELATPTVTRAATRMEAAGLLRRSPHPTDARLVRLVLTDRGRELESVIAEEMGKLSEKALRGLTGEERAEFIRFLGQIRTNVSK
jgi:MarR family transcriptional regulator, organic hydroperoxide resistance regulator